MGEPVAGSPPGGGSSSKKKRNHRKRRPGHVPTKQPTKFLGGKEELGGHHFDCAGYGQSDRFLKTVQKIADYIGQEYPNGGVTRQEVTTQTTITIAGPTRPTTRTSTDSSGAVTTTPPDAMDISDYQSAKKITDSKVQHQSDNRQKVYSLVWQQCTESMHAKIKAHRDFKKIELDLNGIELLRVIKLICFNIEDEKYVPQKVHETKAAFYALKQGRDTDQAYQIKFVNTVQVVEQCGASLGEDPLVRTMVCKDLGVREGTTDTIEIAQVKARVRDYTLGAAFILGADPDRYSSMIRGLKNASLAGRDEWPKNVTDAYNYLSKWEGDDGINHPVRDYEGTAFTNNADHGPREPQEWHSKMTCRKCNKVGHIGAFCKSKKETANTNVQEAEVNADAELQLLQAVQQEADDSNDYYADLFVCEEQEHRSASFQVKDGVNGGRIPKDWVLLDSQSTTDAFSNPDLLRDIHEVRGSLTIHTQAGKAVTKLRGTVPGYGKVWYCPDGIANILSLAHVAKTRLVKFDSTNGNQFVVTRDDGETRIFKQSEHGLYYYDMKTWARSA